MSKIKLGTQPRFLIFFLVSLTFALVSCSKSLSKADALRLIQSTFPPEQVWVSLQVEATPKVIEASRQLVQKGLLKEINAIDELGAFAGVIHQGVATTTTFGM